MTSAPAVGAVDRTTARQVLTDEQAEFRRVLEDALDGPPAPGDTERGPHHRDQLAALGVPGLLVPERHGGAGAGAVELSLVAEAVGAHLVAAPFVSTVLAVETLMALGNTRAGDHYLPLIASGELVAAVAVDLDPGSRPDPVRAHRGADGALVLTGTTGPVIDAPGAGLVICLATVGPGVPGVAAFAVDPQAPGVRVETLETLDLHRSLGRVRLDAAPATQLTGDALVATDRAVARATLAVAAEQFGIMRRTLRLTTDYTLVREQFGRPVGSFQAVKHGLAQLFIRCELAESAVRYAAWVADHEESQVAFAVSVAKSYCNDACTEAAEAMIRYHGGIGYTWEHVAHRYYRRAQSDAVLFGSTGWHHERLAHLLDRPAQTPAPAHTDGSR